MSQSSLFDQMVAQGGRLAALELMLTAVMADAINASPDREAMLVRVQDAFADKAGQLEAEAADALPGMDLRPAAFAEALRDRLRELTQFVSVMSADAGKAG